MIARTISGWVVAPPSAEAAITKFGFKAIVLDREGMSSSILIASSRRLVITEPSVP